MNYFPAILPLAILTTTAFAQHPNAPALQLAANFQQQDVRLFWVSEKLDGVRAFWDGKLLWSRAGHPFMAPDWFVAHFPNQALDGELWLGRGQFDALSAAVRRYQADEQEWRNIRFMVFDLPQSTAVFSERLAQLTSLLAASNSPYLTLVKQQRLLDNTALAQHLKDITNQGGEGVMLRHQDSLYRPGRNQELLKLKQFQDAEARVIAHLPGQEKYENMLGALLVQDPQGRQFRIGSGFSDLQRQSPPAIGSVITYRYQGHTAQGLPRFAHFLRSRLE